jgi:hypothetical protein
MPAKLMPSPSLAISKAHALINDMYAVSLLKIFLLPMMPTMYSGDEKWWKRDTVVCLALRCRFCFRPSSFFRSLLAIKSDSSADLKADEHERSDGEYFVLDGSTASYLLKPSRRPCLDFLAPIPKPA